MKLQKTNNTKRIIGFSIITLTILGVLFAMTFMSPKVTFLRFKPSASPDVASYKMYVEEYGKVLSYDSKSYDLGKSTEVNLVTLFKKNGQYTIGISVVDLTGNESSITTVEEKININFY